MKEKLVVYNENLTASYKKKKIQDVENGNLVELTGRIKITENKTKEGEPYYVLCLGDNTGLVTSIINKGNKLYSAIKKSFPLAGDAIVRGEISKNKTYTNIKASYVSLIELEKSDSPYTADIPTVSNLEIELENRINGISNPILKNIVNKAISANKDALKITPFSEKTAYAYEGGLLHFMVDMCDMTQSVSSCINCGFWGASTILNEDIMLAGAILGNIGKTKTLEIANDGSIRKTPLGIMEEDSVISREIVKDAINETINEMVTKGKSFDKDALDKLSMELLHIISSLKGNTSWGALTTPRSKNAIMLSNINNMIYTKGLFENLEKTNEENSFVKAYDNGKIYYIDEILE